MPYFLIAETSAAGGPLFALWRRDPSGGVSVLPWASPDRRDMQALGRSVAELGAEDVDPDAHADMLLAGALRHAEGRTLRLVELDEDERRSIARTLACEIREADDRPSGMLRNLRTEVFVLVGRHLVAIP